MYEFLDEGMVYSDLDSRQKIKADWLEETKYARNTKRSYWVDLNSIRYFEQAYDRDLYQFSKSEIEEIIRTKPTSRIGVKKTLLSVISMYIDYCCERGLNLSGNPCNEIDTDNLFEVNHRLLVNNYTVLEDFYSMIDNLSISDIDKLLLTLIRYGVGSSYIGSIKWEDVNRESKLLKVKTKHKTLYLPIDDNFIARVDKAKRCESYWGEKEVTFIDKGYLIKTTKNCKWDTIEGKDVNNKINNLCRANNINRISPNNLRLSRKFDLLFGRLEKKGKITYRDYKDVLGMLDGKETQNKISWLKDLFEAISKVKTEKQ